MSLSSMYSDGTSFALLLSFLPRSVSVERIYWKHIALVNISIPDSQACNEDLK